VQSTSGAQYEHLYKELRLKGESSVGLESEIRNLWVQIPECKLGFNFKSNQGQFIEKLTGGDQRKNEIMYPLRGIENFF